ncbi:GxxExxY protein [Thioalkalivibrio sulfidiphilus]|uniref:GxxExxY protein n=1 Tax=Thioalkalivibrio sulfidiphilus TaxID=1033854 RepID=UPI000370056E|nr:GxxExxY protein [Thioalkalivibrio sulfidiphilus]
MEAIDDPLTRSIIASAYQVHNELGFGFLEKVYERALLVELSARGISAETQVITDVWYRDHVVGTYCIDLLVEKKVVCELKAVESLSRQHQVQLVNYLATTRMDLGLLINFGRSVEVRRKYRLPKQ